MFVLTVRTKQKINKKDYEFTAITSSNSANCSWESLQNNLQKRGEWLNILFINAFKKVKFCKLKLRTYRSNLSQLSIKTNTLVENVI